MIHDLPGPAWWKARPTLMNGFLQLRRFQLVFASGDEDLWSSLDARRLVSAQLAGGRSKDDGRGCRGSNLVQPNLDGGLDPPHKEGGVILRSGVGGIAGMIRFRSGLVRGRLIEHFGRWVRRSRHGLAAVVWSASVKLEEHRGSGFLLLVRPG